MLFYLLIAIYLLAAIIIILLFWSRNKRNHWRRVLFDIRPCPFGKEIYDIMSIQGTRLNSDGIVSYSLYGNYQKYTPNLYMSLENISKLLPEWQPRVYVANNIPQEIQNELLNRGAEVIIMGPESPKGHEGALWRFLPAKEIKPFVSLDADDVFMSNTAENIGKWIASGKKFCNLNRFSFFLPMTAGTWGSKDAAIPDIDQRINKYCEHWFGFDESFLYTEIWPIVERYGFWQANTLPLKFLLMIGIIIFVVLIICSLYLAY